MAERTRTEYLIVQTAFLGDLLLGLPFFKQLKSSRPEAKLTVLCRKGLGRFLTQAGVVDEAIEVDKSSKQSWKIAEAQLRERNFELLFCPHESTRSAALVWRLKARRKIGYKNWFNAFIFSDRVARPMELPEAIRQLALLAPVLPEWRERLAEYAAKQAAKGGRTIDGALSEVPGWASMAVAGLVKIRTEYKASGRVPKLSSPRAQATAEKLSQGKPLVFLAPGSVWPTKMWTPDGFAEVARSYLQTGAQVVLMGSPEERGICAAIASRAPGTISIAGETTLYESAEVLALGELLVCNDSGAMHLAAAVQVPTVSIFGPTVLDFGYRPWQNSARVVQTELACRPCGKHGAKLCPLGTHDCMKLVTAAEVLSRARDLKS